MLKTSTLRIRADSPPAIAVSEKGVVITPLAYCHGAEKIPDCSRRHALLPSDKKAAIFPNKIRRLSEDPLSTTHSDSFPHERRRDDGKAKSTRLLPAPQRKRGCVSCRSVRPGQSKPTPAVSQRRRAGTGPMCRRRCQVELKFTSASSYFGSKIAIAHRHCCPQTRH
jgi:hypothetical protein